MNTKPINSFSGLYRFLSNFYPAPIIYEGLPYPSTENAYQAAKVPEEFRKHFCFCTAGQSKRLWKNFPILPNWDDRKVEVMDCVLSLKFAVGSELAAKLLATAPAELIEGNHWNDTFWGICNGKGTNMLGKLLMQRREFLMTSN